MASHRRRFLELLDEDCPDVVWWAPPCTKRSPLQNLNALTEDKKFALEAERDYEEKIHLRFVRRGYEKQYREGRHGGVEQPAHARSWGTKTFLQLSGEPCALDQCAYGAALPDENGVLTLIKKPTRLQFVARLLHRRCTQDHEHLPIEGSSPGIGNRAAASAAYQEGLCEGIAESLTVSTRSSMNGATTTRTSTTIRTSTRRSITTKKVKKKLLRMKSTSQALHLKKNLNHLNQAEFSTSLEPLDNKKSSVRSHDCIAIWVILPTTSLPRCWNNVVQAQSWLKQLESMIARHVICTKGRVVFLCHPFPGQPVSMSESKLTQFGLHHLIHDERFLC